MDFDFFGHQLSFHLGPVLKTESTGYVGEYLVPMPHFGMVMALPDWRVLASRLHAAEVVLLFRHRYALKVSRASNAMDDVFPRPIWKSN